MGAFPRFHLNRALLVFMAPLLALACSDGSASNASQHAETRAPFVVALDHVVPEYTAGAKFRSPATIDMALVQDLATRLQRPLSTVAGEGTKPGAPSLALMARTANVQLTTLRTSASAPPSLTVIPISYRAAPMAIMRTDTSIKRWEQLKERLVCVSQGGNHIGTVAARYGAIEKVYPSPADALIALRTGDCDAVVHDDVMLDELIRLPEWKKFSARLPAREAGTLVFLVPTRNQETVRVLRQVAADWNANAYPKELVKKAVRHIAFEVYLEQDVPDCH